jgi:hypothetical protein
VEGISERAKQIGIATSTIKFPHNENMKEKNNTQVEFAAQDITTAVKMAKAHGKAQLDNALQFAAWLIAGIDWKELMRRAFVEIGQSRRDAGGMIGNAAKFIAPARLVHEGRMTKSEFMALKTADASAAFKRAGGMAGDGLEPDAWLEARAELAAEASKPKAERAPAEKVDPPAASRMSALEKVLAVIHLVKSELTDSDKQAIREAIA